MKKVLALVLAATLALGTASVAFAADEEMLVPENFAHIENGLRVFDKDDKVVEIDFSAIYTEDDDKVDGSSKPMTSDSIVPGTTLYIPVIGYKYLDSGVKLFTNVSDLKDYRLSYSIDDGKNMIKSMKFVKMNVKNFGTATKGLFIALETNDNYIMESQSVDMTLKLSSKNGAWIMFDIVAGLGKTAQNATVESNFSKDFAYEEGEVGNGYFTVGDKKMVLKFDDDADDVTLCFDEDVEVSGNMKGQKDVNVRMKTSNDNLEEKYPDATLRLFPGNKDTFKRDVNVRMPYESAVEKPFIYEVDAKGNLTKVTATYDDVAGEFNFKTKTLGDYILSDTELKSKVDSDVPSEDKPSEGGTQPNPGTGANDFVGLAVALAVVSVAGIAVAKRK